MKKIVLNVLLAGFFMYPAFCVDNTLLTSKTPHLDAHLNENSARESLIEEDDFVVDAEDIARGEAKAHALDPFDRIEALCLDRINKNNDIKTYMTDNTIDRKTRIRNFAIMGDNLSRIEDQIEALKADPDLETWFQDSINIYCEDIDYDIKKYKKINEYFNAVKHDMSDENIQSLYFFLRIQLVGKPSDEDISKSNEFYEFPYFTLMSELVLESAMNNIPLMSELKEIEKYITKCLFIEKIPGKNTHLINFNIHEISNYLRKYFFLNHSSEFDDLNLKDQSLFTLQKKIKNKNKSPKIANLMDKIKKLRDAHKTERKKMAYFHRAIDSQDINNLLATINSVISSMHKNPLLTEDEQTFRVNQVVYSKIREKNNRFYKIYDDLNFSYTELENKASYYLEKSATPEIAEPEITASVVMTKPVWRPVDLPSSNSSSTVKSTGIIINTPVVTKSAAPVRQSRAPRKEATVRKKYPEWIDDADSEWIDALVMNNHLKFRIYVKDFLSFLNKYNLKGYYVQKHGYEFSLVSHESNVLETETFHRPHFKVDEKKWPSWRCALYNLFVKCRIIDGVVRSRY